MNPWTKVDPKLTIVYLTQKGGWQLEAFLPPHVPDELRPEMTPPLPGQPRAAAEWITENLGRRDGPLGLFDWAVLLTGDGLSAEAWRLGLGETALARVPEGDWSALDDIMASAFGNRWRDSIRWSDAYVFQARRSG